MIHGITHYLSPQLPRKVDQGKKSVYWRDGVALLGIAVWTACRTWQMRFVPCIYFFWTGSMSLCIRGACPQWREGRQRALSVPTALFHLALALDLMGVSPKNIFVRVALDAITLWVTARNSLALAAKGCRRLRAGMSQKNIPTANRRYLVVSGVAMTAGSVLAVHDVVTSTINMGRGLSIFSTLDAEQQAFVVKNRALDTLSGDKKCRAVVLDGLGYRALSRESQPFPVVEAIYSQCHTRSYLVDNETQFRRALEQGFIDLKGRLDVVAIVGHAKSLEMRPASLRYAFRANSSVVPLLDDVMTPNGQLFVLGCNTATSTPKVPIPLAEALSRALPGRSVTGIRAWTSVLWSSARVDEGRVSMQTYFPLKRGDRWKMVPTWPFNTITYQSQ